MNREERDIIAGIFERLRSVAGAPRDPEAERFIADLVRSQPYAPYAMAQTIYAQDQALHQMNARIEELQAEVQRGSRQQSGGFLGGLFGGRREPEPRRPMGAPDYGRGGGFGAPMGAPHPGGYGAPPAPWGAQPSRGGGFLAGAMSTAAGVAGGMLLANALGDMFGGGEAKATETGGETAGQDQWGSGHDAADEPQIDDGAFFEDL